MPGIDECLLEAMLVPGARGAALVDWVSGLALGAVGDAPDGAHQDTAVRTAELARVATEYIALGTTGGDGDGGLEDLILTTPGAYHLLRPVEAGFDSSVLLHLWLDRDQGNLALARLRMRDLTGRLVLR
ncbi:hypothetical protein ABT354_15670 [Streptomyces sp. NPDC000594]|uniref:hypothetical protein n=1 Tax=Streptomyces sp. NPDC000594 TaxID=3154261 RepID=UPI00332A11A9